MTPVKKGTTLPWKLTKKGADEEWQTFVRKLEKSNSIDECNAVIQKQLEAGIIERTPPTVEGKECYIPHKGVASAESTKLRIVYDAPAQARSNATSLKEGLNTDSPLQNML